jgi:hypothetical protein
MEARRFLLCRFLLGVLVARCSATIFDPNEPLSIVVEPNACTALAFKIDDRLSYDATLQALTVPTGCNRSEVW